MNYRFDSERNGIFEPGDLDMTPLIDCILLLLVFFMMTTAFFALKGLEVSMPGKAEVALDNNIDDLNVYIGATGNVQVRGRNVAMEQLEAVFAKMVVTEQAKVVVLEAVDQIKHDQIIQIMDKAKSAGIQEIVFATPEGESLGQ